MACLKSFILVQIIQDMFNFSKFSIILPIPHFINKVDNARCGFHEQWQTSINHHLLNSHKLIHVFWCRLCLSILFCSLHQLDEFPKSIIRIVRSWGCFRVVLKRHDVSCRVGKTSTASIIKIDMSYFHTLWK